MLEGSQCCFAAERKLIKVIESRSKLNRQWSPHCYVTRNPAHLLSHDMAKDCAKLTNEHVVHESVSTRSEGIGKAK